MSCWTGEQHAKGMWKEEEAGPGGWNGLLRSAAWAPCPEVAGTSSGWAICSPPSLKVLMIRGGAKGKGRGGGNYKLPSLGKCGI